MLKGARYSAPAGQLRGMVAVLSAFNEEATQGVDCAYNDLLSSATRGFDGLEDPTKVTPELRTACQQLFNRAGLPRDIVEGDVSLPLLRSPKDRQ